MHSAQVPHAQYGQPLVTRCKNNSFCAPHPTLLMFRQTEPQPSFTHSHTCARVRASGPRLQSLTHTHTHAHARQLRVHLCIPPPQTHRLKLAHRASLARTLVPSLCAALHGVRSTGICPARCHTLPFGAGGAPDSWLMDSRRNHRGSHLSLVVSRV